MACFATLSALVLSYLIACPSALECMSYPAGINITCASGIDKCTQTKLDDTIGTGCDVAVGANTLCGMYPGIADGDCIHIEGSGQLIICGAPGYTEQPTNASFKDCPETPSTAGGGSSGGNGKDDSKDDSEGDGKTDTKDDSEEDGKNDTKKDSEGDVQCMEALTQGADDTGMGGTATESSLITCDASATFESGKLGTMCAKFWEPDAWAMSQGCDLGRCGEESPHRSCCVNGEGVKVICVKKNIMSGVPTMDEFENCTAQCPTVGTVGGGALSVVPSALLAMLVLGTVGAASGHP